MEAFKHWLTAELNRRNWPNSELARQAGISRPLVSRTLRGDMSPSADFCIKVAIALDTPPETVLRLAGILPAAPPSSPEDDTTLQQLVELARSLPSESRQQVLEYVRFLTQQLRK